MEDILSNIPDGTYLLTRGWFNRDEHLQLQVAHLVEAGHGDEIYAVHGDFAYHIQELCDLHGIS